MQYTELNSYFVNRLEELLNKRTPDSYRVKIHNVLSCLEELCELVEGWQRHRIQMAETVILCAEECKSLIQDDEWIDYSFYDRQLFIKDIEEYIKVLPNSKDKRDSTYELSSKIIYTCRKCVDNNSGIYADKLFSFLIGEIGRAGDMDKENRYVEEMESFEKALSSLCNELLRLGHSKNHLYLKASALRRGELSILELKTQLLSLKETTYEVIYKFQSNSYIDSCKTEYDFVKDMAEIKSKLKNQKGEVPYAKFLNNDGRKLFKIFKVEALDTYAAIKKAKDSLALLLDTLHLGNNENAGKFDSKLLVLSKAPTGGFYSELRESNYQLDGLHKNNPAMSILLKSKVDNILENIFVKEDVKERLKSALRHLRIANGSKDIELRFVNYWIALEFIFSSPLSHENTFTRIKKHLVNILCCSYISRNIKYLDELLHSEGVLALDKSLTKMTDKDWGSLIDLVKDRRTQYRLCKLKSQMHSEENIEKYITTHKLHLEWHIARLYRMRNELIHEAALKQDIEGPTSNLRFYLVFILNQMVDFFYNANMNLSINDFFHYFENMSDVIFSYKKRDQVLNIKYEMSLIT